jgi:hypothetical protein
VHGTGETVKSVVVEQLPVVVAKAVVMGLFWAFADTIDNIATARPATKSDAAFMAVSSLISGQQIPSRSVMRRGHHIADCVRLPSQSRPLRADLNRNAALSKEFESPEKAAVIERNREDGRRLAVIDPLNGSNGADTFRAFDRTLLL